MQLRDCIIQPRALTFRMETRFSKHGKTFHQLVLDQMVAEKNFFFSTDSYHAHSIKAKEDMTWPLPAVYRRGVRNQEAC